MVKKIVHSCLKCVKANPKPCSFLMGDLPSARVTPSRPFSTVGVDYAGPVYVKENTSRRSRLVKLISQFLFVFQPVQYTSS